MRIDDEGPADPHGRDASTIRPRIFLEGNFFVDVQPGTPSAPTLGDGDTIPINQTAAPVQLDQILTRCRPTRATTSRRCCDELAAGLERRRRARATTARSGTGSPPTRTRAIVNDARSASTRTTSRSYIAQRGRGRRALDRHPARSSPSSPTSTRPPRAFAAKTARSRPRSPSCRARCAPAEPALDALNAAFPAVRAPRRATLRPAVRSTGPALDAALPFVRQLRGLVCQPELRGLVADLRPTVPALAQLNKRTVPLYEQVRAGVELPERGDPALEPATSRRTRSSRPAARSTRRRQAAARPRRREPLGRRQRPVVPRARRRRRTFAYALGTGRFVITGSPLLGVNPPPPTASARRCAPTCRARRSSRPTCARPGGAAAPPARSRPVARRLRSKQLAEGAQDDASSCLRTQIRQRGPDAQGRRRRSPRARQARHRSLTPKR